MFDELDRMAFIALGITAAYIIIAVKWDSITNFLGL